MLRKEAHIAPDGALARSLPRKFYKHVTPTALHRLRSPVRGAMFIETNNKDRREAPEERHVNNAICYKTSLQIACA